MDTWRSALPLVYLIIMSPRCMMMRTQLQLPLPSCGRCGDLSRRSTRSPRLATGEAVLSVWWDIGDFGVLERL